MATYIGQEEVTTPLGSGTLQYGERDPVTGQRDELFTPAPTNLPKSEVGMLDTGSAASRVTEQNNFLNTTYPASAPATTTETGTPIAPTNTAETSAPAGRASFVNQAGQEFEATQEQLNDPNTQKFLRDNGYVLAKSEGVSVGADFTTSGAQRGVNDANAQLEDIAKEMLSWRVEDDMGFQNQSLAIKADFDKLRREMEKTNFARQRQFETLGFRSGMTQYGNAIQMGIEGEELRQGAERISDIARQESAAISAARLAYTNQKWSEFNNKVNVLKDLRDQKQKELENYNKAIVDFTKNLQEQQKFEFEVFKYTQEQKSKDKPMVVAPGSSIYDPSTGEFIGTAPKPLDTKAPEIEKWGGMVHQWNPNTGSWETLGTEDDFSGTNQGNISAANLIAAGKAKLTDYPADQRGAISTILERMPPKQEDVKKVQTKISELENILNHPGLDETVGPTKLSRIDWWAFSGAKQDFIGKVQKLLSEKTLQSLIDAKADGATFGALSEGELRILQEAASTIGSWAKRDGSGNVVGYRVNEKAFKEEIKRIKEQYETTLKESAGQETAIGTVEQAIDDYYLKNPSQRNYMDSLESATNPKTGQKYTNEEKAEILGIDFNQPLNTGLNGSAFRGAVITGYGSKFWKPGLDIALPGGKSADVKAPGSGTIAFVGSNGGFGNQVKIKLDNGQEVWLSHFDRMNVKKGQRVGAGQVLGKQGNSGKTYGKTGIHVDITMPKPGGGYYTAKEVAQFLNIS